MLKGCRSDMDGGEFVVMEDPSVPTMAGERRRGGSRIGLEA